MSDKSLHFSEVPPAPQDLEQLEEALSRPTDDDGRVMEALQGDLMILGAAGKMGPTLARLAKRAIEAAGKPFRVIGVSRFSDPRVRQRLESWGIETIQADLMDAAALDRLPDAANVIYMLGFKFGASGAAPTTWAVNCYAPALVAQRYPDSRIAAFSTGNVYPLVPVDSLGSREGDATGPVGEYAMSALGRERMFEYFSSMQQTPVALLRLNYATELRYGVLVNLANRVFQQQPIDVTMGYVNVIWQRDANAMALAALGLAESPARVINIAGEPILRVRDVAERFAQLLDKPLTLTGQEAQTALLNDGRSGRELCGQPTVGIEQIICWTAEWVARGGESLKKPTHFQVRDGKF